MALGFVRRQCRVNFNPEIAKMLFTSLVRSHLEFANVVWNPHTDCQIKSIESVQKQATIFIRRDYIGRAERDYVLDLYIELSSLIRRRINTAVMFIRKIVSG